MTSSWNVTDVCDGFESYQDLPEQLLGYRFVFRKIKPERENCQKILDYGCGPGKVAFRFVQMTNKQVLAVDESPVMLSIASKERVHPLIEYQLVSNNKLEFIEDNSLDGALACYVFINLDDEERIIDIFKEIHRVLKPETPFVILDTNPDTTGVEFSTSRSGVPNKNYGYGEAIEVVLYTPSKPDLILSNYHWPKSMYQNALKVAGFSDVSCYEYTLADIPENELHEFEVVNEFRDWKGEWQSPPFVIFQAVK